MSTRKPPETTPALLYRRAEEYLRVGRLPEARRAIERCIGLAPGLAAPRTVAAIVALNLGEVEQAEKRFGEALRRAATPGEAAPNRVGLGRCLLARGKPDRALSVFSRARRDSPRYPPALEGVASANLELGRYGEAEGAARAALQLQDNPGLRVILARSILFQGRIDEAEAMLRPLRSHSGVEFETRLHLAAVHRARGRVREAADEFRALLRERPNYPLYYELAKSKHFASAEDADLKQMRETWGALCHREGGQDSAAALRLKTDVAFALGTAQEEIGAYAEAWRCYAAGNDLHRELEAAALAPIEARISRARALDYRRLAAGAAESREGTIRPVLIVSPPRSGSSLLGQMLGAHPEILPGGETGALMQTARERFEQLRGTDSEAGAKVGKAIAGALSSYPRAAWTVDKALDSFTYVGLIAAFVPKARFIILERHPMDTAWSQYTQLFANGLGWAYSLDTIAQYAELYREAIADWHSRYRDRMHTVYYEALVMHPEGTLRGILDFLELAWQPACLEFQHLDHPVWTASNAQVREALNHRGIGRWLPFRRELADLYRRMEPEAVRHEAALEEQGVGCGRREP